MTPKVHHYEAHCSWFGSTAGGYRSYDRAHTGVSPPAPTTLALSSDSGFGGDPSALNPEQLLVISASSCQLLSFLSVAARAGVDVLAYDDDAHATMTDKRPPMSLDAIHLHPTITVAAGSDVQAVAAMVIEGHEQCFIANTLRCEITVTPTIVVAES